MAVTLEGSGIEQTPVGRGAAADTGVAGDSGTLGPFQGSGHCVPVLVLMQGWGEGWTWGGERSLSCWRNIIKCSGHWCLGRGPWAGEGRKSPARPFHTVYALLLPPALRFSQVIGL